MLELVDVEVRYGLIPAVRQLNLTVRPGEIVSLVGANGAGKTTTLNAISGVLRPTKGEIRFGGRSIAGLAPEEIVRAGIIQTPEGRRIFPRMTVMDNLLVGAYTRTGGKAGLKADFDKVFQLFPRLVERRNQLGGTLSGGEQQMLAIGRALMARPKLLLTDEPSLGIAPIVARALFQALGAINREGTAILLVEQNARSALRLSHRGYVLETGQVKLSGPSRELLNNPWVQAAYLGGAGSPAGAVGGA